MNDLDDLDDPDDPAVRDRRTGSLALPRTRTHHVATTSDPSADRLGDQPLLADRYVLGRVLGSGGAADVHVATDTRLARQVAVKLLRETAEDLSDRKRFVQEAHVLAQLAHPGIVTVLDAGFTHSRPFFVLELVEGLTLGQLMARGPLPAPEVADVGAQVAAAMDHAHHHGVVHRDIKPSNVIVGNGGRIKVVDFGIARIIGDTVRHTRTGTAVGTAAYLAPEQVVGGQVEAPADVYALGLTLLEALTGERAFPGPSTESALARLHRPPDIPETLPPRWRRLLSAMTASDPGSRPTAEAVSTTLRSLVDDVPTAAPGDDVTARLDLTRPLTAVVPPPVTTAQAAAHDRQPAAWRRVRPSTRAGRLVAAGLVALFVVIAVLVAIGRGSSEPGPDVPADAPAELRGPLGDLHDAVEGR